MSIMRKIGLIAGNGRFPKILAKAFREKDIQVVAVGLRGETLDSLEQDVDRIHWVDVGQLQTLIEIFKQEEVKDVAMAGGITKTLIFSGITPDERTAFLLSKLKDKKDDLLLRSFAEELEKEGITVQSSTHYLPWIMAEKGCLTKRFPTEEEHRDIEFGWSIAKGIGELDIGQTVVVKDQVILAVEAIEGTDEAIKRGGGLGNGGAVVVKVKKPNQDMRFDLPVVGTKTIISMVDVKATVLAVEADSTIMLEKNSMIEHADEKGISIIGIE